MAASTTLTALQLELMRVLWARGQATVVEVHREITRTRELALPTIATLLRRLEARGAVAHHTEGRQFIYRPLVAEADVQRSVIGSVAERIFTGDVPALIHRLLSEREVTREELNEVRALIEAKERELRDRRDAE